MSISLEFPFSAISDNGNQSVVTTSVQLSAFGKIVEKKLSLDTLLWKDHYPQDKLIIDIPNDNLNDLLEFKVTVLISDPESLILFYLPSIVNNYKNITTSFVTKSQHIPARNVIYENTWVNLDLKNLESADFSIDMYTDTNVSEGKVTYHKKSLKRLELSDSENIEYYLGKDKIKNLFFQEHIPHANEIPAVLDGAEIPLIAKEMNPHNKLGYRSDFEYNIDDLKNKDIILCFGDCDTAGLHNDYNNVWTKILADKIPSAKVLNFGIVGISVDGIARLVYQTISSLKNSNILSVCVLYSWLGLREFVSKNYKSGVYMYENHELPYDDWFKHIDWQSNNYNFIKNRIMMESIAKANDVPFWDLYINRDDPKSQVDYFSHGIYTMLGPHAQEAVANYFYKKINNQPSLFDSLTRS